MISVQVPTGHACLVQIEGDGSLHVLLTGCGPAGQLVKRRLFCPGMGRDPEGASEDVRCPRCGDLVHVDWSRMQVAYSEAIAEGSSYELTDEGRRALHELQEAPAEPPEAT